MATNFQLKPFVFNLDDITYLLRQVTFKPLFDAAGNAVINWDGISAVYDRNGVQYTDMGSPAANLAAYGSSYASVTDSTGIREVTGNNNNLLLVNKFWGAVDQPFLQTVAPDFTQYVKPHAAGAAGSF
jgi:hypothetical protein